MKIFSRLLRPNIPTFKASAEVPLPPPPKTRGTKTSIPSYLTSATPATDSFLPQSDLGLANTDITSLRAGANTSTVLRNLGKASPDLSSALFSAVRMAVSSGYLVLSRNLDGTLNEDGTRLAQQLCRRFDLLGPTKGGFNNLPSIRSTSESLGKELMLLGGAGLELILGQSRLPEGLQPITIQTLRWKYNGNKKVPYQVVGGEEISLDIPTFFYVSLDQDLTTAYAESPVQASVQPILAGQDFMNDLRRVFRRAIHPRVVAKVQEELWKKNVPISILNDPDQLKQHMDDTINRLQDLLDGLNPEDALVYFDTLSVEYLTGGNNSLSKEYETLSQIINGKMSSGAKSMPVVLGHDAAGSTNIASTQSMLFVKSIEGAIQLKLNEIYSKALTVAIRLFGVDAVVEFAYNPPNLRPESELEAFNVMKKDRHLDLLSLGLTSDAEVSLLLTGSLPLPGAEPLSGTRFKDSNTAQDSTVSTPESNTGAKERTLNPDTPKGAKTA